MKLYRVVNISTYAKRVNVNGRTANIPPKDFIEEEMTEETANLFRRSPDFIVSEPDLPLKAIKPSVPRLNLEEYYTGQKETIAPSGDKKSRPLYEHFMVEFFGLKSRIVQLEGKVASLEEELNGYRKTK